MELVPTRGTACVREHDSARKVKESSQTVTHAYGPKQVTKMKTSFYIQWKLSKILWAFTPAAPKKF